MRRITVLRDCPLPFTLTPGRRAVLTCPTVLGCVEMPVVVVDPAGPDLKLPDGTVARFAGPALTYPEPAAWARLLWRYPAIRAAIAEKEGAF